MFKFLSLAIFVIVFCIGCSNPTTTNEHITIGATDNIIAECNSNSIFVHHFNSITTSGDIYFYLDSDYDKQMIIPIPDSTLFVMGKPFNNLSAFIAQDVNGDWYMQIIIVGMNLCMSVGGDIEIKPFTIKW